MSAVEVVSSFHDDEFFRLWGVALLLAYMVDDANSRGCGSHEERWKTAYRSLFIELGKAKQISISELIEILDKYRGRWQGFREHSFEATIKPDSPEPSLLEGRKWTREELERIALGYREEFENLGREDKEDNPL